MVYKLDQDAIMADINKERNVPFETTCEMIGSLYKKFDGLGPAADKLGIGKNTMKSWLLK